MRIFPDCPTISRTVEVGGVTKSHLIEKLQQSSILMNDYGERLFENDQFMTSDKTYSLKTIELTVMDLGFPDGATTVELFNRANECGLDLCPLELGPHLRLEYLDQPESESGITQKNQAPSGSITIASERLTDDDNFPRGFYLRRMDGVLWLRGYIADDLYVWKPEDHFIFVEPKNAKERK